MKKMAYGLGVEVQLPFDDAKSIVIDALHNQGFGVEMDLNPVKLLPPGEGAVVVDCRILLRTQ